MAVLFVFQEDRIVCEPVYFDSATILRRLGFIAGVGLVCPSRVIFWRPARFEPLPVKGTMTSRSDTGVSPR